MTKSRKMRWVGHVPWKGEMRNLYKIVVVKPEGRKQLRRSRHRWEDSIKIDLREMGLAVVDQIHLAQDSDCWWALANIVMNLLVP
jgi:hypothetical protein